MRKPTALPCPPYVPFSLDSIVGLSQPAPRPYRWHRTGTPPIRPRKPTTPHGPSPSFSGHIVWARYFAGPLVVVRNPCARSLGSVTLSRPGFLWAGIKTISAKREWPDWRLPAKCRCGGPICRAICRTASIFRSARAHFILAQAFVASMARTSPGPSAPTCRPAASACATRMSPIFISA